MHRRILIEAGATTNTLVVHVEDPIKNNLDGYTYFRRKNVIIVVGNHIELKTKLFDTGRFLAKLFTR
jgi:hypothetical protein